MFHLQAAGEVAEAGDLVAASWPAMWSRGQAETVRRWLESFTDQQILRHKPLTLTAGWIYTALDAGELGARWGKAACTAVMTDDPSPDGAASLRSSQALLRATVAPAGVKRMREDAELAARLEKAPDTSWYADAHVALGVARWLSGAAQRALSPLTVAARQGSVHNPSAELAALGYLALIAVDEGDWDGAAEYEARATTRLAELGFGTNRRCLPMLLARVQPARARGRRRCGRGGGRREPPPRPHGAAPVDGAPRARRARRGRRGVRGRRGRVIARDGCRRPPRALPGRRHPAAPCRAPARRRGAHAACRSR